MDTKQLNPDQPLIQKAQTTPSAIGSELKYYPKLVNGFVELFVRTAQYETQLTNKGSVALPNMQNLVPSGGAKDSLLVKTANTDFATGFKTLSSLMNEFLIPLPVGANLSARIQGLNVVGLELSTAFDFTPEEVEFGTDADTLVIKPSTNMLLSEVRIFEKTATGNNNTRGWKALTAINAKTNSTLTASAILGTGLYLDPAKQYLVYVRFLNPVV